MKAAKNKISDNNLENVSGGYWETSGYAEGAWIECPFCGARKRRDFYTESDDWAEEDIFVCLDCGQAFTADEDGITSLLN